ncbi:HNH endonuclease signature motif containing protein [Amycolatopsis sp. NPDC004079]|uniref:HNH endonuclease signature motif containing protein n=1 Tax=Amycolatopsis sp. NPDC004079 TaxID=3154549 RepID=UPI0033A8241C
MSLSAVWYAIVEHWLAGAVGQPDASDSGSLTSAYDFHRFRHEAETMRTPRARHDPLEALADVTPAPLLSPWESLARHAPVPAEMAERFGAMPPRDLVPQWIPSNDPDDDKPVLNDREQGSRTAADESGHLRTVADRTDNMTSAKELLALEEVAALFGVTEKRARDIIAEGLIAPVTAYPADAVFELYRRQTVEHDSTLASVVPCDARLPGTLIHKPTTWEVHPNNGMVYSLRSNRAPQLLGFVKSNQLCATRTDATTGEKREWRIGRVVWEAVNSRSVPDGWVVIHRNGDHLDNRYSNLYLEPQSVITDKTHPSSGKRST